MSANACGKGGRNAHGRSASGTNVPGRSHLPDNYANQLSYTCDAGDESGCQGTTSGSHGNSGYSAGASSWGLTPRVLGPLTLFVPWTARLTTEISRVVLTLIGGGEERVVPTPQARIAEIDTPRKAHEAVYTKVHEALA